LARTNEAVVIRSEGVGCDSTAAVVAPVEVHTTPSSVTFSWKRPQCDESLSRIDGYEYSLWKRDDGAAPETTSFTEQPFVTMDGLTPDSSFLFRVRPRLVNGHGPWSGVVEAYTSTEEKGPIGLVRLITLINFTLTNSKF
jgi:hypothetical protein